MKNFLHFFIRGRTVLKIFIILFFPISAIAQVPLNNNCTGAFTLTSAATCITGTSQLTGTLLNATASAAGTAPTPTCGGGGPGADVWYVFKSQTANPTIRLNNIGASLVGTRAAVQLLSGTCGTGTLNEVGCYRSASGATTLTANPTGLNPGQTYYLRVYTTTAAPTTGNWVFDICVTEPPAVIDYSKSYINITKGTTGGTVQPGDILEIRATMVVRAGTVDSIAYYDTLNRTKGFGYINGSLAIRTNEGKVYKGFTDANDADAGWIQQIPVVLDSAIQIRPGRYATNTARSFVSNTSIPSFYGGTCILMATFRVQVYAPYNTKIRFGGGKYVMRDAVTGLFTTINFKRDSLIVYNSPGLCPNAVSPVNAIGIEANGTFGTPAGSPPLVKERTSAYTNYMYQPFTMGAVGAMGPQDYYYTVSNNTSMTNYTVLNNWFKPDGNYRLFGLWDIIGDHTGASNPAVGNPPCDTTLPRSASNPCGYMLVVNSAYRTDTAFQYTATNLCPNTYYEISAWLRNICYRCGCDSLGRGSGNSGYIPLSTGDSSGVQPNLAFDINGTDYYTTGNIEYFGTDKTLPRDTTPRLSDARNRWVKRGFTYRTGPSETSFTLTIRNNAPGGGGNDWAMDDISIATCLPNMQYSPSLTPYVCEGNSVTIRDTIRSYFNNYTHHQWQRSTDGGLTWTNVGGVRDSIPVWNATLNVWQYVSAYTIPSINTNLADSGDLYRVIVATTSANLLTTSCQVTDGINIITLDINDCGPVLNTELLSFNGKLINEKTLLTWSTSKEELPVRFIIEKSLDGQNFQAIGEVNGYNNSADVNHYAFTDPTPLHDRAWYRISMITEAGKKKYSSVILLRTNMPEFDFVKVINPFNNNLEFDISSSGNGMLTIQLLDITGKTVRNFKQMAYVGVNSLKITDTQSLPAGVYTLRVINKDRQLVKKVMKR